jgi:ABC-type uncharacterized transport system ATPase subunit
MQQIFINERNPALKFAHMNKKNVTETKSMEKVSGTSFADVRSEGGFSEDMQGTSKILETEALTRRFGTFTAVDALTTSVGAGEVFGLVGPNGAGKTTAIKMLTTYCGPRRAGRGWPVSTSSAKRGACDVLSGMCRRRRAFVSESSYMSLGLITLLWGESTNSSQSAYRIKGGAV